MSRNLKIAVFSDTRLPTVADGGHGLGMSAHSIATGLAELGHDVILCAAKESEFDAGEVLTFNTETEMALWYLRGREVDVVLDTSHHHKLSQLDKNAPVLNRICDRECPYNPPNAVVNSAYMQHLYPGSKLIETGIQDPDMFRDSHDGYLLYASRFDRELGYQLAMQVAERTGHPLRIASRLNGSAKWELFAGAMALLHPSSNRAAPRLPIEVGFCGVPTICLDRDGTAHMVQDGVTGLVCTNVDEMVTAVSELGDIDRLDVYNFMANNHDYDDMIADYEQVLVQIYQGLHINSNGILAEV
jgi:hypothetical protein